MSRFIDLTGERFGRLIVLQYAGKNKWGHSRWLCLCDCGEKKIIVGKSLGRNLTKSCGCLHKEELIKRSSKHGHSTRIKISMAHRYCGMGTRCRRRSSC